MKCIKTRTASCIFICSTRGSRDPLFITHYHAITSRAISIRPVVCTFSTPNTNTKIIQIHHPPTLIVSIRGGSVCALGRSPSIPSQVTRIAWRPALSAGVTRSTTPSSPSTKSLNLDVRLRSDLHGLSLIPMSAHCIHGFKRLRFKALLLDKTLNRLRRQTLPTTARPRTATTPLHQPIPLPHRRPGWRETVRQRGELVAVLP